MTGIQRIIATTGLFASLEAAAMTPKERGDEFQFITSKIENVYSHLESKQAVHGFSYEQLKSKYADAVNKAKTDDQYIAVIKEFLASFHDGHLKINLKSRQEGAAIDYELGLPPAISHKWVDQSVLVTKISRLWGNSARITKDLDDQLIEAGKAKTLIVDLRGNTGGDDAIAYHYISRLIAKDIPLGRTKIKMSTDVLKQRPDYAAMYQADPANKGWSAWRTLTMETNTKKSFPGQIFVLIDKECYSSCESAAQAFKNSGAAKLVGQTTGGGSANPIFLDLPTTQGQLMVPTWVQQMANGKPLEDVGVSPDVAIDQSKDALEVILAELGVRS